MKSCCAIVLVGLILTTSATWARSPKVAVFDPERSTTSSRFVIDKPELDRVASVLAAGGVDVARLTATQIADGALRVDRFDAFAMQGNAVPTVAIDPIVQFTSAGGVLILTAAEGPLETKIAQKDDKTWRLDPEQPKFAWQTTRLHQHFGVKFLWPMTMAYSGVRHEPVPPLTEHLPSSQPKMRNLLNRWFVADGGRIIPLIRSTTADGADYTPQIWIAEKEGARAIIAASTVWTGELMPDFWPHGDATLVALAHVAADLRHGRIDTASLPSVTIESEPQPTQPLHNRVPAAGTNPNPDRVPPLVRWGRFDGSRLEFGMPLEDGQQARAEATTPSSQIPGAVAPNASLVLDPGTIRTDQPVYLRVRFAVNQSDTTLRIAAGDRVLWNETLVFGISGATGNLDTKYGSTPLELNRIVFVPPEALGPITLSSVGAGTIYLDAVQLETRPDGAPLVEIGMHTGVELAYNRATALTPAMVEPLTQIRATSRPWWVGPPDDPKRWDRFDAHIERYLALGGDSVQLILEGTPEWAAAPNRWAEGGNRKHMTPPLLEKFVPLVERIAERYGSRIKDWEIGNETNIRHFWLGSPHEYAQYFLAIEPVIRRHDPNARVITAGMAGTTSDNLDPFIAEMACSGVTDRADLFGFHAYAGQGLWDLAFGLAQGHLLSVGADLEIQVNEQGYTWMPGQHFSGLNREASPAIQHHLYNIAMGRLMASGAAKIINFNMGGDKNDLGLIDEQGTPRPAWSVMEDYLHLVGGQRLDPSITAADGSPLRGVYVAGAATQDSVTLVINPAEHPNFIPVDSPATTFDAALRGQWTTFFGSSDWSDGRVRITLSPEKGYAGFFRKVTIDPRRTPQMRVVVHETPAKWQLLLKSGDQSIIALENLPASTHTVDLAKLLGAAPLDVEISFRTSGGPLTLDAIEAPPPAAAVDEPVRVRVAFALPAAGHWTIAPEAAAVGPLRLHDAPVPWAELDLAVTGRTVVRLAKQ